MTDLSGVLTRQRVLAALIMLPALAVSAVSVLSMLGGWLWPLDLLSHYRLQYALVLLLPLAVAIFARSFLVAGAVTVLFVLHLVPLAPLLLPADQPEGAGVELRVIQANVLVSNDRIDDTSAWLVDQDADVIVVQEVDQRWLVGLEDGLAGWGRLPTDTARSDSFGMVVFVRDGLDVAEFEVFDPTGIPAIAVELAGDDGPSTLLYAIHTRPPLGADATEVANEQLEWAADVLGAHDGPQLLVGDLNTTRWGSLYRGLRSRIELRDSADGQGLTGTWPSQLWFTGMIGIDHVLVSSDVRVDDRRVGPNLGSDHRAVVVDLTLDPG